MTPRLKHTFLLAAPLAAAPAFAQTLISDDFESTHRALMQDTHKKHTRAFRGRRFCKETV